MLTPDKPDYPYLELAADGILLVGDDGEILYANPAARALFGRDDLVGAGVETLVPEPQRARHPALRERYVADPHPRLMGEQGSQLTALGPNGREFPAEIGLSHLKRPDGTRATMAVVRDISARLAIESGFRSAFSDAPMGMMILAADGDEPVIAEANHSFCTMVGRTRGEVVGRAPAELTLPDDREGPDQRRVWLGPGPAAAEKRFVDVAGRALWCRVTAGDLEGYPGARHRLVHVVNIDRRVRAEQARDRREELLSALSAVRRQLLEDPAVADSLAHICDTARRLLGAAQVAVLVPRDEGHELAAVSGGDMGDLPHGEPVASALAEMILAAGQPVGVNAVDLDADAAPIDLQGRVVGASLMSADGVEGVLVASGVAGHEPVQARRIIVALAAEAALAIQLARARRERRRLSVVEDRDRIARDLHDLVIQRLFAAGMRLQSAAASGNDVTNRMMETVGELDETIAVIRESIFRLTSPDSDLGDEVATVVGGFATPAGNPVRLEVVGAWSAVPTSVAEQLLAALNELLSNANRHSRAEHVDVDVVIDAAVTVEVRDDGVGFDEGAHRGFGLGNVAARARNLGGSFEVESAPGEGTCARWTVPLGGVDAEGVGTKGPG